MLEKPVDQISWSDLEALINQGRTEDRRLEFKRQLPGGETEIRGFLATVTSLANTDGGDIIYGMDAPGGIATTLMGVPVDQADDEILRLEQFIRDCTDPRLVGHHIVAVPDGGGRAAILVRLPASYAAPHRMTHGKIVRFVARDARGKYEMDSHQLRRAFAATDALPRQMRDLHSGALSFALGEDMPFSLQQDPALIVTIAPMSVLREPRDFAVSPEHAVLPMRISGVIEHAIALEGVIMHTPIDSAGRVRGFAINHRRGYIDAAWTIGHSNGPGGAIVWDEHVVKGLPRFAISSVARLRDLGLEAPWIIMATLTGLKDYRIVFTQTDFSDQAWRDSAYLGEVITEHVTDQALSPMINGFWRLFGIDRRA